MFYTYLAEGTFGSGPPVLFSPKLIRFSPYWPGLAWAGLAWPGLAWSGSGLGWPGLAWPSPAWPCLALQLLKLIGGVSKDGFVSRLPSNYF